jgi:hypothetical protein
VLKRVAIAALAGLLLAPHPVGAQYFGRNKVQYDRFEFRILQTPHFDIHYYAEERDAALQAARMAERWYTRLSAMLDHRFDHRTPIILYASHGHFAQTSVTPVFLGDGIGGLTDHQVGRVVLPFAAGLADTDHVLGHELVHAFQRDILKRHGSSLAMMPLWFAEGMAEYLSVGKIDTNTAMWLRDSVRNDRLPRLQDLDNPRFFPYRYGQALWAFLSEKYGETISARALKLRTRGGAINRLATVTGAPADVLSREWREAMTRLSDATPLPTTKRGDRAIVAAGRNGGRLNVGPALSPDGAQMVFLSERDGYSVDVFLAEVKTGTIVRKLLSTATDPHFDSIQFIESAGAWTHDGRRFALATVRDGTAMVTIFDMPGGGVAAEIPVADVDEVFAPTWSPDGEQIAFSGLKGGMTDLYVLSLDSGAVRALTSDMYADVQPDWSPDGRQLGFVTDRFSSSLDALAFGAYQLASLDVESGAINPLPSIQGAKNIDPHWSPDGASVYFIADRGGVSNIFRVPAAGGDALQLTDVSTGVSGITALSPAMSVAARSGAIAYAVYRDGTYEIHELDADASGGALRNAIPLEPRSTVPLVADAIARPAPPAGPAPEFLEKPYPRGMSVVSIGQPYLSAGGGAFGSFVRAGVSFGFGDMLGEQQLETAVQVGKDAVDFAVQTAYLNRRSRWTWGGIAGQIPSITGVSRTVRSDSGEATFTRQSVFSEQIHRQATGLFMYPFSRAQRIELSAGLDAISFRTDAVTGLYSAQNGRRLEETRERRPGLPGALVAQTSAALVYDTSVHGAASPILGERYRLGIAPTFGDLRLATVVADFRKYVMPIRPFTIALRIQHVGRYGRDAADPRLLPFVWFLQDIVRGYDGRMLPAQGCDVSANEPCDTIDATTTRKLIGANIEMRFPLVGAFRRNTSYGRIPLEGVVFSDAGAFWTGGASTPAARTIVRSAGVGLRLNAGGFVFEFDAARPLHTPAPGWRLSVNFRPGF